MPREGTHTWRTANYAVNLRVYTRTRNNAGNFGRLHADPAVNVQRASSPRAVKEHWGELCGVPRGLCGRRARKTPELEMFTLADGGGNEVQPMVTNERETGEKVHMHGERAEGNGEQRKNICVFAPVPRS